MANPFQHDHSREARWKNYGTGSEGRICYFTGFERVFAMLISPAPD
jgi:hypothetical protein